MATDFVREHRCTSYGGVRGSGIKRKVSICEGVVVMGPPPKRVMGPISPMQKVPSMGDLLEDSSSMGESIHTT
ncbi:unnamed protein product, partial [Oppiella nova]